MCKQIILPQSKNALLYLIIATFCSCSLKGHEHKVVKETIPENPIIINLSSTKIISADTASYISRIQIIDDRLVTFSDRDQESLFHIYSISGEYISSFGRIGNGGSEFSQGIVLTGQYYPNTLYIQDVNKCTLFGIDLDASIEKRQTIIDKSIRTKPMTVNVYHDDSLLIYESMSAHVYKLDFQALTGHFDHEAIELNEPTPNLFAKCYGVIAFNPQKSSIAKAMIYDDNISFFSYDNEAGKTFKHKNNNAIDNDWMCYGAVSCNNQYIYALYVNQSIEDTYVVEKPMEIILFDWNGNYFKTLNTAETIMDISVDKENKYLYGVDTEGNVYKYSL